MLYDSLGSLLLGCESIGDVRNPSMTWYTFSLVLISVATGDHVLCDPCHHQNYIIMASKGIKIDNSNSIIQKKKNMCSLSTTLCSQGPRVPAQQKDYSDLAPYDNCKVCITQEQWWIIIPFLLKVQHLLQLSVCTNSEPPMYKEVNSTHNCWWIQITGCAACGIRNKRTIKKKVANILNCRGKILYLIRLS